MAFHSILFDGTEDGKRQEALEAPDFFADLNLNPIIDSITAGRQEYSLKPYFYRALNNLETIRYRQAIMQDLEDKGLFELIKSFTQKMRAMREQLTHASQLLYKYQRARWFFEAVDIYGSAVQGLVEGLARMELKSRGLLAFRDFLRNYTNSTTFTALMAETNKLKDALASVKYCLLIKDRRITVGQYDSEMDYSAQVLETFEKFKQGAVKDHGAKFSTSPQMNPVEARVLELIAQLYPDVFQELHHYCVQHANYLDQTIGIFDREVQFYIAYLEYLAKFKQAGLGFCYPEVSRTCKAVYACESFDLALANKLIPQNVSIVCNDFYLNSNERIMVVSGPNQGGKTTFARTFGQVHYLTSLGCPVPGRQARLFVFDRLFTHFEREENITTLRGKLQNDLVRIHDILNQATANSILIVNEIFTSTTLEDAVWLSTRILSRISDLDLLCVCVTFIDELASLSEKTVSMVSMVVPDNPARRTYKIVRRSADGLTYALSIAEKYRLTYALLKERIKS